MESDKALVVFQRKSIRRTWHNDEWYFSVVDVIEALTDSLQPKTYWAKIKDRDKEISQPFPFWEQLKLPAEDGKMRETNCASTEGIFRIIQSIPSKKAEPFKRWLAKVGYERVQEIENPELAQNRARRYYGLKGYPDDWINKRIRGIAIRQELTDEWEQRGIKEQKDYAILTNEIHTATFDISLPNHKIIKGIDPKFKNQNLRDNMTDLELIFNMLGEAATTEITRARDVRGFVENNEAARKGGSISGEARQKLE